VSSQDQSLAGVSPCQHRAALAADFPGNEAELRPLREWLPGSPDAPARDDAIMVAVELATNAVKHTASGQGGFFAVESWTPTRRPSGLR
jgi:hypothetical protein